VCFVWVKFCLIVLDQVKDRSSKSNLGNPFRRRTGKCACALVKLGTSAGFIGCVGKDQWGKNGKLLQEVGVDSTGVQRHPTAPTQVNVLRSESGDRIFAGFYHDTTEFADTRLQVSVTGSGVEAADF